MRIFSVAVAAMVSGCAPDAQSGQPIACAGSDGVYAEACRLERAGNTVVVTDPDGGVRRLMAAADGTIMAADGAEAVTRDPDGAIVIGAMRYRLP